MVQVTSKSEADVPEWRKPKAASVAPLEEGSEQTVVVEEETRTVFVASDDNAALRRAMYSAVMKRIHAGKTFTVDGFPEAVELHSADDDCVYIFGKRRGNGDKRNCQAMPIWEFCEKAGIKVSLA